MVVRVARIQNYTHAKLHVNNIADETQTPSLKDNANKTSKLNDEVNKALD